ncbi:myosin light chain kinase, smooth muscle-like isoform X2 [Cyclopterus lumpus]|nr:myosin light chain kinase, smooth muscle-like isoform X2 [Cyclopterus lumpus]XP_034414614.1 myosin light chain kinase, smooth muscle-like isoform X2 [Cyclopterus lumpus]
MDKDGGKPKTFVSTFCLALQPQARSIGVVKQKEDATKRTWMGNNKLGVSSATDSRLTPVQALETPHFKQPLRDCAVCEGSNGYFQGVITGSRPLSVSWLHNGKRVHSSNTSFQNGVASLILTQCSHGDAGTYACVAENTAGKRSSSAVLHITATKEILRRSNHELHTEVPLKVASPKNTQISSTSKERCQHTEEENVSTANSDSNIQTKVSSGKGPPVEFVDPPEQVEVRVGKQARLHCEFRSSSVPVACCWIYNKTKVVVGGPRMSVRSSETQSDVEISQACPEDTGSYTVMVRNAKGSAQHTVSLGVIDQPDPPASQPVISQLSTESVVLSWTGPSFDGGTAVLGYKVEVRQEGQDKNESWTEVTSRCKNTTYHIRSGLAPLGRYCFRVRAYNSAGVSEPSQESECVEMVTKKEEKKGESESYITVTIDTKHKAKDHYNVHEKLGVGKFGQVFRMSHKDTGQEAAGKFYRARTAKDRTAARKEIELMNSLHHPKLVQCLAAYETSSEMVMVMEYIAGGELFERIVDDNFEHTEPTSARYMQQILEGMQYVHTQNIVHLDIKPENIVCVNTTGTRIKIIDFGLAAELEEGQPLLVMHGTPEFVAPEVISYEPVGLESDMWSIGVICFILLSGESPFQGNTAAETLALVTAAQFEFDQESFEDISDEAKDFISSLLKKDRRCRLSCAEALAHPWMASFAVMNRRPTKSLNKGKMKRFLARRKWKKTGKAVLALQRMANLSYRPDSPGSSLEEPGWSQEAEEAFQSLDKQLQSEPRFQQALKDATLPKGATLRLTCLVNGYPQPEVKWLQNEKPVSGSRRVTTEQHEDGLCSLVVADLELSDSGVYVCRASNKLGEGMCSAKLKVEL